jgi:hypothetical protein
MTLNPLAAGACWAASIGGCGGGINNEHIVSDGLFGKRIRVVASRPLAGHGKDAEVPVRGFKAPILCTDHNRQLGSTADWAAIRLWKHLQAMHDPMQLPGSRVKRAPADRRVSGTSLGRWLCKTHCNCMIALDRTPDAVFVEYAFLRPLSSPLHFYFRGELGETLQIADDRLPRVGWTDLKMSDSRPLTAFQIQLGGFCIMVSVQPFADAVDRIRELALRTPLGPFRIIFDWSGEPVVVAAASETGQRR